MIIVQGGAYSVSGIVQGGTCKDGGIDKDEYMEIIKESAKQGYYALKEGGTAVDAVETAVRFLEDSEHFNARYGSPLSEDNEVECNAMIMDGHTLKLGALVHGRCFRNPVSIAKFIMEEEHYSPLSGEEALEFAKEKGFNFQYEKKTKRAEYSKISHSVCDSTVSAVARDINGHFACALSTGGVRRRIEECCVRCALMKGCVGHANKHGAATTSRLGESIIGMNLAEEVVYWMERGMNAQVSTQKALDKMRIYMNGVPGVIAIDHDGNFGIACTEMMSWASIKDNTMEFGLNQKEVSSESVLDETGLEKQVIEEYDMNIVKARSLALRFTAANPRCVRAIPCEVTQQKCPFTMYLYVDTDSKGIPKDFRESAVEMFPDYQIEFVDLQRRPLCKLVTHLPPSEKRSQKELRKLANIIEKNLHVFENRLNVTAVQASYKVEGSTVKDTPCVTVYVLGKGKIPAGETDILEMAKLENYPFDVVEGYFLQCGDPKSYASPLQGGVGIGVEDERMVGTLGAFLEDEDGKRYILSCQHVLGPNEKSERPNKVIVQPAELDHQNEVANIKSQIKECTNLLKKREKILKMVAGDERRRYEIRVEEKREILEKLENDLTRKDQNSKPRAIGKYCRGLKQNETVEFQSGASAEYYVDAAIAELNDEEAQELIDDKEEQPEESRCRLYGFKNVDTGFTPTGEIVDVEKFDHEDLEKLRFVKSGRTTGHTDGGQLETSNFFAKRLRHQGQACAGGFSNVPFKFFCNRCLAVTNENMVDLSYLKEKQFCFQCRKEIKSKVNPLWANNCLAIRRRKKPFCEEGDSGALVFDNRGRAWGMIFGVFAAEGINFDFGLASPLSVTLQALEKRLGKKLHLWCVKRRIRRWTF